MRRIVRGWAYATLEGAFGERGLWRGSLAGEACWGWHRWYGRLWTFLLVRGTWGMAPDEEHCPRETVLWATASLVVLSLVALETSSRRPRARQLFRVYYPCLASWQRSTLRPVYDKAGRMSRLIIVATCCDPEAKLVQLMQWPLRWTSICHESGAVNQGLSSRGSHHQGSLCRLIGLKFARLFSLATTNGSEFESKSKQTR